MPESTPAIFSAYRITPAQPEITTVHIPPGLYSIALQDEPRQEVLVPARGADYVLLKGQVLHISVLDQPDVDHVHKLPTTV